LTALAADIEQMITPERKKKSENIIHALSKAKKAKFEAEEAADKANKGANLHMHQFASVLSKKLPADAVIFDEALTNSPPVTRYIPPSKPGHYFVTRGGSLGVGFPGAIGIKFADKKKTVVAFSGDGGSMYTIQALWSAVRHNVGAKFIVCNNGSYKLLQLNIDAYWNERKIGSHDYPLPFDLSFPNIRFDILAQSMGVEAVRVEKEEEIEPAINRMLADDKPFLIDLVLEGNHKHDAVQLNCSH
jgi:benzoylformate decarboxylase